MRTHVVDTSLHKAIDRSRRHHILQFTAHVSPTPTCCIVERFGSGAKFSIWQRSSLVIEVLSLFSGLGTDVHFSGNETGLQWKDFELQNAVEWRIGDVERSRTNDLRCTPRVCCSTRAVA